MTTLLARAGPATYPRAQPHPVRPSDRPPNRLAMKITGRPYLSHSQLSLMRSCPRKFSYTYVEKAPPDFIPVSLIFGGAIHTAYAQSKVMWSWDRHFRIFWTFPSC